VQRPTPWQDNNKVTHIMAPRSRSPLGAVVLQTLLLLAVTSSWRTHSRVTVRLLLATDNDDQYAATASRLEISTISNDAAPAAIIRHVGPPTVDAIAREHRTVVTMYSDNNETSTNGMDRLAEDLFEGKICERIIASSATHIAASNNESRIDLALLSSSPGRSNVVLRVQFHCRALFEKSGFGTGNFISAMYALRMAAQTMGNIQAAEFLCSDASEEASHLILPWLTGLFPLIPEDSSDTTAAILPNDHHQQPQPTIEQTCRRYLDVPIGYAVDEIMFEMRRLAVALVGIPYPGHPAELWAQRHLWSPPLVGPTAMQYRLPNPSRGAPPLIPNVELDDAVLHFRCGDLILSNLSRFGFMKFARHTNHLLNAQNNITSIGIATQPFAAGPHARMADVDLAKKPHRCRRVVDAVVEHLQFTFPHARIRVRNDPDESIALTFARMVMAKHVVVGISTFGVFPAVASFGRSYVREPDYARAPNRWLLDPWFLKQRNAAAADGGSSTLTLIREPRLTGADCRQMWGGDGSAVLDWLRSPP
jgi:hypothetical protein